MECKNCYGKGYATQWHGKRYEADFVGDKTYQSDLKVNMKFCKCERGKDLEKIIKDLLYETALMEHHKVKAEYEKLLEEERKKIKVIEERYRAMGQKRLGGEDGNR